MTFHDQVLQGKYTFALLKPDAYRRGLLGQVLMMAEGYGIRPVALGETTLSVADVQFLYGHVEEKYPDVWPNMLAFMTSGPSYTLVLKSTCPEADVVQAWRNLMGYTKSWEAHPTTIRGRFGDQIICHENVVHGSDSRPRALEEIQHFYGSLG